MSDEKKNITACPACNSCYRISDSCLGKRVTCRKCGIKFEARLQDQPAGVPILGKLAVMLGLMDSSQLREAMDVQQSMGTPISDASLAKILVDRNMLPADRLPILIEAKKFWDEVRLDKQFAAACVKKGITGQSELDRAFKTQLAEFKEHRQTLRIGDILVNQKLMTGQQRDALLLEQDRPVSEPVSKLDSEQMAELDCERQSSCVEDAADLLSEAALIVSDDGLEAYCQISGRKSGDTTLEALKALLAKNGIVFGILEDSLLIDHLNHPVEGNLKFKVAQGRPPKPGTDASVTYYFEQDYLKVGALTAGGNIDFSDRGQIPHVKSGDLLAQKTPMLKAEPGKDVYGNPVEVVPAKDVKLLWGAGVSLSEDKLQVFAKVDGQPKLSLGGKLSVLSDLKIPGDVSLKTGHIAFDGNVHVAGTIQNGFRVSSANLAAAEILGADIVASGNVVVNGGVIGATIKAQGYIKAKYIKDSVIGAYGDITAAKEIIDSEIETSGACKVDSGKIISSVIAAKKGVAAVDIGTDVSKPCKLKAGTEDHIEKELAGIKNAIARRRERLLKIDEQRQELNQKEQPVHKEIAELAQVQDRAIVQQRTLAEELDISRKEGAQEKVVQVQKALAELEITAKAADEAINRLFDAQDSLAEEIKANQEELKTVQEQIQELCQEKITITEWSQKDKGIPMVTVKGSIYSGTMLAGVHSSQVLEKTLKNIVIKEVKMTDPDADKEWGLQLLHRS